MTTATIPRTVVDSRSLASVGYSVEDNVLVVEFRSGALYQYRDVPNQAYDDLLRAESKGGHFNRFVRSAYRYERIAP